MTQRLLLLASLGLGACSGADGSDAALDQGTTASPPSATAPVAPELPTRRDPAAAGLQVSAPRAIEEAAPTVTGIDEATAPAVMGDAPAPAGSDDAADAADVPSTALCEPVADWDPDWVAFEEQVLSLVNEVRSQPADCGAEGRFAAAAPLKKNPILRCSARLHSLDMYERNYFDHDTPDGVDPFQRMAEAGFVGSGGGENIALGQSTPEEVMAAWMDSDGHCANIMRASFDTIGVGYHPGAGQRGLGSNYWTQNFGAPAFTRDASRR